MTTRSSLCCSRRVLHLYLSGLVYCITRSRDTQGAVRSIPNDDSDRVCFPLLLGNIPTVAFCQHPRLVIKAFIVTRSDHIIGSVVSKAKTFGCVAQAIVRVVLYHERPVHSRRLHDPDDRKMPQPCTHFKTLGTLQTQMLAAHWPTV